MVRGGWNFLLTIFCVCVVTDQCINIVQTCRHNINNYTVTVDEQLSPIAQQEIELHIQSSQYKTVANALNDIQKKFEYIQKIEARAQPHGNVEITIKGSAPDVIINTEYLLASNGVVTHSNRYVKNLCATLPRLYYPGRNPLNAQKLTQKVTKAIGLDLLKKYETSLFSEEDIHLTPLDSPQTTMRCCLKNFPNTHLLSKSCRLCAQELQSQKSSSIVADLRFKSQIIVTKKG